MLITALGTITSSAIMSQLLRRHDAYCLLGADINPASEIVSSRDVDEYYVFPSAVEDEGAYLQFVLDFCRTHRVRYVFASIDEEVANYSAHRAQFEALGVKLCIPNAELIQTCHYKDTFAGWMAANVPELAIKTYTDFSQIEDTDFPVFVKPIEGRGSIGCRKIGSREKLRHIEAPEKYIAQEYLTGEVITVDVIRNARFGQLQMVQRRELLRNKNGCGTAVQTADEPQLREICRKLAEKLQLNGVVNMEFFQTKDGYRLIEINPRYSAGSLFSMLAGCELVLNEIRIADGEPCVFKELTVGRSYARRYEIYEM